MEKLRLRKILEAIELDQLHGWLFLPGESDEWTLDTEGGVIDLDAQVNDGKWDPRDDNDEPPEAARHGWHCVLDVGAVAQCIHWADREKGGRDDDARLRTLRYYHRFDAFPANVDEPVPPPLTPEQREAGMLQIALGFYDSLGPESPARQCRRDGCSRGAVEYSVLCRVHHFESIKGRCPFDH